jgi:RNA polymerase sigma-70 factor (ECF subfamily)
LTNGHLKKTLERFLTVYKIKEDMITLALQGQIYEQLDSISQSLRAFSLKLTGNSVDAEDLYQDTALRIINNADKYRPNTNFKAWAVTIMRNIFINNYRKRVRRGVLLDQTPNNYYINSGESVVDNDGEHDVSFNELMKMVDSLPDDFKVPFWMAYEGYKYDEIAEELGAPLGTIKSRIFFARKKLQRMYTDMYQERA